MIALSDITMHDVGFMNLLERGGHMIGLVRPLNHDIDCKKQVTLINEHHRLTILRCEGEGNSKSSLKEMIRLLVPEEELIVATVEVFGDSNEEIKHNLKLLHDRSIHITCLSD